MTKHRYDYLCTFDPEFAEAFSLTRNGLYFKGSNAWFGGYSVYHGGRPLVDSVIAIMQKRGAEALYCGTDSMLNQLSYELIYATARVALRITGGNTFCGGKGAWLNGGDAGNVAATALMVLREKAAVSGADDEQRGARG